MPTTDAISALAVSEMRHTGEEDSFKSQWLRFVPPGLTVADSVFELCASSYNKQQWHTDSYTNCVLCEVLIESLYITWTSATFGIFN